ncbi:MAG: hypothetical protein IPN70_03135 [Candidatus Moraniibacteriota bacterium]|nr:MAG: hypothetical protein IPN70_03135 [Candidatus Moranbacteria bacterium]
MRKTYIFGFIFVIFLVFIDLFVFFFLPNFPLRDVFLATREQNPLTWISSVALFLIALFSFHTYWESREKIWWAVAFLFTFFSIDDAIYFHERLSGIVVSKNEWLSFFPTYIWILFYLPALSLAFGFLGFQLWNSHIKKIRKYTLIAFFLLGIALILDILDGIVLKDETLVFCLNAFCEETIVHSIRLCEEIFEAISLGIFGICLISKNMRK